MQVGDRLKTVMPLAIVKMPEFFPHQIAQTHEKSHVQDCVRVAN